MQCKFQRVKLQYCQKLLMFNLPILTDVINEWCNDVLNRQSTNFSSHKIHWFILSNKTYKSNQYCQKHIKSINQQTHQTIKIHSTSHFRNLLKQINKTNFYTHINKTFDVKHNSFIVSAFSSKFLVWKIILAHIHNPCTLQIKIHTMSNLPFYYKSNIHGTNTKCCVGFIEI